MNKLLIGFDPKSNMIDKRILYEITGRKESQDKFSSSCSSDDENSEI
eukprot:CAMPEP_0116886906 /NCGR_PEP_ID=MMETSP0463-20121206/20925_1 /TAXON_ID=181622 /ORGANISM="Strombidinopsis sp, Strain SopsisLIS2011" /LENGTH=46 /DNA_ID= /DNA_START= /DNA_END= /DNA_ORIENTATION=